jgi:hypothetical protein
MNAIAANSIERNENTGGEKMFRASALESGGGPFALNNVSETLKTGGQK